jgi:hypothetical protein
LIILILTLSSYTQIWFGLRCMFPTWSDWDIEYTKKGQTKRSAKKVLNIVALAAMIVGGVRLRRNLQGRSLIALLKAYIRMTFLAGSGLLQTIASRIA